jgi:hypothetical protein
MISYLLIEELDNFEIIDVAYHNHYKKLTELCLSNVSTPSSKISFN